jgi:hypothetical protein
MNLEQLKQQLAEGKITKEQFKAEVKKLLDSGAISQEQHDDAVKAADDESGGGAGSGSGTLTSEEVQRMIAEAVAKAEQSAADRVRTEYSKKNKELLEQLEELKKQKMSAEEKAEYERQQKERELREKEAELLRREVALHTVDKLRELELPLEFRDILAGSDIEDTDRRIGVFQKMWQDALKKAVDERFKNAGHDPGAGRGGHNTVKNPWSKEHWNLTEQGRIYKEDRQKAIRMAAEHGIKLT